MLLISKGYTFLTSITWRASFLYLFLLCGAIGASGMLYWITWQRSMRLERHKLYWNTASALAEEIATLPPAETPLETIMPLLWRFSDINPVTDVFVLNSAGIVLFTSYGIGGRQVDTRIVEEFLSLPKPKEPPLLIENPSGAKPTTISFSAARINLNSESGYLLVSTFGFRDRLIKQRYGDMALVFGGGTTLLLLTTLSLAFGIFLYRRFTRRIERLNDVMAEFEHGRTGIRAPIGEEDEVGMHARTFNAMAQAIEETISRLQEEDAHRRSFVAAVSKNLQEPVAALAAQLAITRQTADMQAVNDVRSHIEHSLAACQDLHTQISELLELAKLDSKEYRPHLELVAADDVFSDLVYQYQRSATEKQIDFHAQLPDQSILTLAELRLFNKTLSSLLDRAVRVTPRGGKIQVSLQSDLQQFKIIIEDDGPSLTEEQLHTLSKMSEESTSSIEKSQQDALPFEIIFAQRILETHGGSLTATALGTRGTKLQLSLPTVTDPRDPNE